MKIKNVLAIACLSFTLTISGCASRVGTVTNTPTGVTQAEVKNWYQATGAFTDISTTSHNLLATIIQIHDQGNWTDKASYETALRAIGKIDQTQIEASKFLKTVPDNWSQPTQAKVKIYTDQIAAEFQNVNSSGATGIKNPTSLQTINDLLGNGSKAVSLILSLLQAIQPQA